MGQLEAGGRAFWHNVWKPIDGASQLLAHGVSGVANSVAPGSSLAKSIQASSDANDAQLASDEANYQKTVPDGVGTAIGATAGTIAPFLLGPLAEGASAANAAIDGIGSGAARLAARVGSGAAQGAAINALNPTTDPTKSFAEQKLDQLTSGAIGGGVAAPVGAAVGRVLSPVGNAAAQMLRANGIRPTAGQMLGATGSQYEQKLSSVPLVGDLINAGRSRAIGDYNRAIANDALSPIGQAVPDNIAPGADMVSHVRDTISNTYDNIARNGRVVMDTPLQSDITALQSGISQDAPALAGRFNNIVNNQLLNKNGGNLTGDQWANTRSMINKAIRDHSGPNASSDDAQMVNYLNQLQDSITANAEHYSNTSVQQDLAQANTAYARYKALEKAAGSAAGQKNANVFTPTQYLNATRAGQNAFQRATSSGANGYPAQQLSHAAQPLLGATVPDSGTAGRGMVSALFAMHNPVVAAKAALAAVPYLPGVRNVMPGLLSSRPDWMRAAAPVVRNTSPIVGGGLLNQGAPQAQPSQDDAYWAQYGGMLGQ
ncbi:hypothetical protein [Paraburkholderia terrae]|uniref:hypothetical protein n=1 Tax=Paraburkholderia terrae TaxID=311230 RepID=UPI0020BF4225|nr:hypothetical protein [Paraburkholderia terrae]